MEFQFQIMEKKNCNLKNVLVTQNGIMPSKIIATMIEFKVFKIQQNRPQFSSEEGWQFAPLHWVYIVKHVR